ncbi:MAG: hypothetical protein U5L05_00540 [Rubrivivax sp.]|nr:hypothetical protein [Rubrivivax sp.]
MSCHAAPAPPNASAPRYDAVVDDGVSVLRLRQKWVSLIWPSPVPTGTMHSWRMLPVATTTHRIV